MFRRYWGAHTISLFGDQVSMLALPLVAVLELDAGAASMGYLTALGLAPYLLFALHAGAWVDRRGRRRSVMIAADIGRAALLASVPVVYVLDALTLEQLYAVAFLTGVFSVLFGVSDASLFQAIVPREQFVEASSLLNGSRAFSFVAGPSASGVLVQILTAPGALATATINFFNFVFFALFVLYATKELDVSPATLGLVLGAGAVGGLVGSAVATPITRLIGVGPTFVVGCVLFPAPILLVPLAGGPYEVVLACLFAAEFGSGLGVMLLDIAAGAIFAAVIPTRLRSRVSGAYTFVNYGIRVVGSLVGGLLGSWLGLRPALWIGAAGAMLGVLFLLPSPVLRLETLPEAPD